VTGPEAPNPTGRLRTPVGARQVARQARSVATGGVTPGHTVREVAQHGAGAGEGGPLPVEESDQIARAGRPHHTVLEGGQAPPGTQAPPPPPPYVNQTTPPTWADPRYVVPQMRIKRWSISIVVEGRVIENDQGLGFEVKGFRIFKGFGIPRFYQGLFFIL
jgi:hypothetical protein